MKRKSIALLMLVCLMLSLAGQALAADIPAVKEPVTNFTPLDTTPAAEIFNSPVGSALLIELNSGTTLYALNATEQRYPASLT